MAASQTFSSYPNGFAGTLLLRGVPLVQTHPGKVFWVSNNTTNLENGLLPGSNGNTGGYRDPFSTIEYAINQTKAGRGDIVLVKPGHAETIADATSLLFDTAGIAVIGLGNGSNRPTLTFSATTSAIPVSANDIVISNFLFIATAATTFVAAFFTNANAVVATDFTIDSCEFRDNSATTGFVSVFTGGTTANQNDGLTLTSSKVFRALTSPPAASTAIVTAAAINRPTMLDNFFVNKTANNNIALGWALGANAAQNVNFGRNRSQSLNTGTTAGELFSGGSTTSCGLVYDNYSWHLASTGLLGPVSTKLGFIENYCSITGAADKSALINPVAV